MLTDYINNAALKRAQYEQMDDGEGWFGTIPGFPRVWGHGKAIEETRLNLASALEGWIILGLHQGEKLPVIDGIDLTPPLPARKAS